MKIYFASVETHIYIMLSNILFSYYDITDSPIPFRKESWRKIIENKQTRFD